MPHYKESTKYETGIIAGRMQADEVGPVALHRLAVISNDTGGATVIEETNDDNDDGYPDGLWVRWETLFDNLDTALKHAGHCRVGISGVIVTVTLDGEEIREQN